NIPFYEETYPNIALVVKSSQAEEKEEYEQAEEYSQKVDHSKLFGEIRGLEKELRSKWYKGTQERQLDRLARGLYYLQKLGKISLVPLEWEEYIQEIAPFTIDDLARLLKQNGISLSATDEEIAFLEHYRQEGETFYKIAIDRERAMVENSLAVMRQRSVAKGILRTGGFHTSGISQFLKANGISYIVIAPRVTQPDMPTPYQEILKETMEKVSQSLPTDVTSATLARQRAVKPAILDHGHEPK
ncbi:MAG: hypothetical protein HYS56_02770, partial [Candidatus Omnitrophica bacterium]|nr:hypothetical protein [Candidatus Omnitrophota bacterium]